MLMMTGGYFLAMKFMLFFAIVRALVKSEPLQSHILFLSLLYTACVGFLSYVFLLGPQQVVYWQKWQYWLGITFVLSYFYFKLLVRFEEGILFFVLLIVGFGVALF